MKYTLQEARTILGVTKDTPKEEIEKRYDVILKKYRIMKQDGSIDENAEENFKKSTDAYRIIMGYEVEEPKVEKKETYADKAFEKAGIDRKKADNFFHYYKYHILAIIAAIVVVIFTIHSFVTRVEPDITIGLLGEVNTQANDALEAKIKANVPEIKEMSFDSAVLTDRYNDQQSFAYLQKAMVLIAASDIDLYIVNKFAYNHYANSGAFMALDDLAKEMNLDTSKSEDLKLRVVEEWEDPSGSDTERKVKEYRDQEPRLYGIDVTDGEFFKGIDIIGPEKIIVIRAEPKNRDLVLKLLKLFAK